MAEFEKVRPELTPEISAERFMEIIKLDEEATQLAYKLNAFANLSFAQNTQDQAAQSLMARVDQFMAELSNRSLFFSLWWKDLPDAAAERLMAAAGDIRYWLEEMRHFKPHTLSEAEEKIINIKNVTGSSALGNLYDSITNRYTFKMTMDGEEREMTRGELMVYARHHDPALRAAAYQELYRVYGKDGPILGQIYQTLVRDWRNEQLALRKFTAPISARNLANDIPDAVVNTLLEVSQRNAGIFQRFFRLKARLLGIEKLRRYDIYAPVAKSDKKYAFDEAVHVVLDSFYQFAPRVSELARRVFAENHLDSEVRKGKRGGAFCASTVPDLTPWVLLNYQGRADDVATMAHELGHAIHAMLAGQHTIYTYHSSLPLAETASTFGEMMLVDRLLAEESDEARAPRPALPADRRCVRHHPAPGLLRPVRAPGARDDRPGRFGGRAFGGLHAEPQDAVRRCGRGQRRVQVGMGLHPAYLPGAVLRVCLHLRPAAGAFALPAVQKRRRSLQAALFEDPFHGRLRSPGQDPGRRRDRYLPGLLLAGRFRCPDRAGRPVGKIVGAMYFSIEGVIGVGKTTLARLLQPAFEAALNLEVFEENPFLSNFYQDRARYAFQTQMFFLLSRYHQQRRTVPPGPGGRRGGDQRLYL